MNAFYKRMNERFREIPGVRAATVTNMPLVSNDFLITGITVPGTPQREGRGHPVTAVISVGPTFFATMQLPILLGRPIDSPDVDGAPFAAVVNEVFVKKFFPGQNPIEHTFALYSSKVRIVGVAKNARYSSLKGAIPPVTYISYIQHVLKWPPRPMFFELRTAGDPLALTETVRNLVHRAAPTVPVTDVMTQTQRIDSTITQQRTFADLCTAFAFLALAIACVDLYGAMAYEVSRRTNEIGIRIALGAERRRIVWMVLPEVIALAAAGVAVGYICAWIAMPVIKSFVFGMKPTNPATTLAAMGILIAALLLTGYVPARRASRIDAVTALRHE